VAPPAKITPANAVHALGSVKHGVILNDYNFGGYLDFVGIAPFIDGRSELYGEAYLLRYDRAVNLQNLPDFEKLLDDYRISATLLAPSTPAVACSIARPAGNVCTPTLSRSCILGALSPDSKKIITTDGGRRSHRFGVQSHRPQLLPESGRE